MLEKKLLKKDPIFSVLSGHNFYHETNRRNDIFGNIVCIAEHMIDGTVVSIRYNNVSESDVSQKKLFDLSPVKWSTIVEKPVLSQNIPWPQDVVTNDELGMGIVFRDTDLLFFGDSLKDVLYDENNLGWSKKRNMTLVNNILDLCESIQASGYEYHCYDMNRMFYDKTSLDIRFDFSRSITRRCDDGIGSSFNVVKKEDVGKEFLPPWMDMNQDNHMTITEDIFSMTALIFRLMVGLLPYQGKLMDGKGHLMNLADNDEKQHLITLEEYRKHYVFIFDSEDKSNSIDLIGNEERFTNLWKALPESIKDMFSKTFTFGRGSCSPNDIRVFPPSEWKKALMDLSKSEVDV